MRLNRRGKGVASAIVAIALISILDTACASGGGQGYDGPASLPEDLKLSGVVNGRLTSATAVRGMTSSFPVQASGFGPVDETACVQNASEGWKVDLYGLVGAHMMSLSIGGQDESGSNMAGDYLGSHAIDNNANFGGIVNFYWGSENLTYPVLGSATLVVNPDGHSGTMDIQFSNGVLGNPPAVETISGTWRCK